MITMQNRIIFLNEHKTSMRLTSSEWYIINRICIRENLKRDQLINLINNNRFSNLGLTPTVRLFSLLYLHNLARHDQNYAYAPNSATLHETLNEMSKA